MNPSDVHQDDEPAERKSRFWQIMNASQEDGETLPPPEDSLKAKTQPMPPSPAETTAQPEQAALQVPGELKPAEPQEPEPEESPAPDQAATIPVDVGPTLPSKSPTEAVQIPDWLTATTPIPTSQKAEEADTIPPQGKLPPESTTPDKEATRAIQNPNAQQPVGRKMVVPTPAVDRNGMPLPRRVDEIDPFATRVTPSAVPGTTRQYAPPPPPGASKTVLVNAKKRKNPAAKASNKKTSSCLVRFLIAFLFFIVLVVLIAGSFGVYQYYRIAATLPAIGDLQKKASQFETTRILDRNGNTLYEILDPNAGRRTNVTLDKISPYLIAATIATEDKDYYTHPGFDPLAILRALLENYTASQTVSGASTITQQLARALLFTPEERSQRTVERKAREIVLSAEITRRYTKDQVLELYLNENYYGNLSYGIEAAAETYFQTSADKLTLAQAAFLAGLPQAPSVYDVYNNRDETMQRFHAVLLLMLQDSKEKNCIEVSNNRQPVCVVETDVANAAGELNDYQFKQPTYDIRYPHWVNYVRSLLEQQYDPQTIYRSGFTVYTTIDPNLQDQAEQIVREQVDSLSAQHVTDGALVAIQPSSGQILAMVGSADFYNDAIAGQVNMAVSPRQPGSSIKPITYVAAFEKGWTPSTLIWDVPTAFPPSGDPNDPRPPYEPTNYDNRYHGPVTVRTALSNSYNIPAVKTLYAVGVYGDPSNPSQGGMINMARRMGITSLTRQDYGLALTLGGGEVSLLEMTGAYAIFANQGQRVPPVAITKIVDYDGNVVFNYKAPAPDQVIRPEHAFLISDILSDNAARTPAFGANSVLNVGFPAAVKTGTTNDFKDNWTLGYTPDLAVGVWVGNADDTAMIDSTGVTGAAPIWSKFIKAAIQDVTGGHPTPFTKPAGIVDKVICADSGTEATDRCASNQRSEYFASDQLPLPQTEDFHKNASIDTWTGLGASAACPDFLAQKDVLNVVDPTAIKWINESSDGKTWADKIGFPAPVSFVPSRVCKADDPRPNLNFSGLSDGQTITTSPLDIFGTASVPSDFEHWRLWWGEGDAPTDWKPVNDRQTNQVNQTGKLTSWDMKDVPTGRITLKLHIESVNNFFADRIIHLNIHVPTATPTPTATATLTPTPTATPTQTPIPPSATPEPPTATPVPPTSVPPPTDTLAPEAATSPADTSTTAPVVTDTPTPTETSTP